MKIIAPQQNGSGPVLDFAPLLSQLCKTMTLMQYFSDSIKNGDISGLKEGYNLDNFKEVFASLTEIFSGIIENMEHVKKGLEN